MCMYINLFLPGTKSKCVNVYMLIYYPGKNKLIYIYIKYTTQEDRENTKEILERI